ncbi:reverse transcriptase N-terminal domain-containing protein [Dactylosporangium sp. CA-233914]|uniref:reverse transcriptase N-terminal domain-containing protein n=1 Tax=Dactylosporangium sp. CA-233914 TaxID=3239934 RepID=UPI003D8B9021
MTAFAFDVAMAALGANRPEDKTLDWDTIVWPVHEEHVRRLRGRIFKASKAGDLTRVRNLQKMTAPRSALLYPRLSREEFEGRFLDPMPYLDLKGKGNHSMAEN